MRVVLGPTNFANQPLLLAQALRTRGVEARHVHYAWNAPRRVAGSATTARPEGDEVVGLSHDDWLGVQLGVLEEVIKERPDVVHLWNRSLVHPPRGYGFFAGMDLPHLRASGIRIVYRFTGFDLRAPTLDRQVNAFSPFHRGYSAPSPEAQQQRYIEHLRQWVDVFVVQDPEMRAFLPEAEVVPRAVDLDVLAYSEPAARARPLIVHAPSDRTIKGTPAVLEAVAQLRARGVEFDFELLERLPHAEVLERCRRADVVVDQVLIGWYGVFAVEAMALGKPVVAYLRPGLAEQLDHAPPIVNAAPDRLAEALEPLIGDAEQRRRLGVEGRRFVEQMHDVRHVAAMHERLYERAREKSDVFDPVPRYLAACAQEPLGGMAFATELARLRAIAGRLRRRRRTGA
jgi:glycosyltransferase involved in cell wall biosynthesis